MAPRTLVEVEYRQKIKLVAALSITLIVSAMSQTVVSTAAQNIVADIGGFELFTWMFAGFSLASAVAVPVIGKLADIHGTRPVISISFAVFLLASAAAGAAPSMEFMIVARAVQGLGFAGVLGSIWITTALMWEPQDRAKWLGALSGSFTLAGVAGPVLGGVVSDQLDWRWIFWFNLPVGGLALWFLLRWFPRIERERRERKFDIAGAVWFSFAAISSLFAVSVGGDSFAWSSPVIIGLFVFGAVSLALFVRAELKAEDPVFPVQLLSHHVFSGSMMASLTVTISFVVTTVFIPLLVIGAQGRTATESAYPLMTQAVGVALGANIAGQVLSRWGRARELSAGGLTVVAATLWILSLQPVDVPIYIVAVITFMMGLAISNAFTSFTVPVQNAMPNEVIGIVTSSLQFARVFGMAVGSAVLGAILLAGIGIPDVADPGPTDRIQNPEVVVSEERLDDVRVEYLDDPELGQDRFDEDLSKSRQNIADALRTVFQVGAIGSAVGVALAIYTFTGSRRRKPAT